MGVFALLIGGRNSVPGAILVTVFGLVLLWLLIRYRAPRTRLRLIWGSVGWKLQRSDRATGRSRNTSQAALVVRLLIGVAVIVAVWLLLHSR